MVSKQTTSLQNLRGNLLYISKLHMVLAAVFALYIILSDATQLITPDAVLMRWELNAMLLASVIVVWYFAKNIHKKPEYYTRLVYLLVITDVVFAGMNVYTQRGMASRAVLLFVVPILTSAILLKKRAIVLTAALSSVIYILSAVKYFVDNFNEGYKAELYIEVGFYCVLFFIMAKILGVLLQKTNSE